MYPPVYIHETHKESYLIWKKKNYKNAHAICFDAHLDVVFDNSSLDSSNFLTYALQEKILSSFTWVIPGELNLSSRNGIYIKKLLHKFPVLDNLRFSSGRLVFETNGAEVTICNISSLPTLRKKTLLLDVDIDFLLHSDLYLAYNPHYIQKRQWISLDDFYLYIKEDIQNFNMITLSYSVHGGFTPIVFKHLADKFAYYLGKKDRRITRNIKAGEYFLQFRKALDSKMYDQAKICYRKAIKLNPSYLCVYNNLGLSYLRTGQWKKAGSEFRSMLTVDKYDINSLTGLALIYIYKKDMQTAKNKVSNILKIHESNQIALLILSYILYKLEDVDMAVETLQTYISLYEEDYFTHHLLGKIAKQKNQHKLSHEHFIASITANAHTDSVIGRELLKCIEQGVL